MCSCSQHTVFWLSFFPERLEFLLKGRKSLIILLVEDSTHFWFFCSVLKAASGSPTYQISDLPETIQRERNTSVCFFLSIFGHFSKSHHILWQKNEMKDVFSCCEMSKLLKFDLNSMWGLNNMNYVPCIREMYRIQQPPPSTLCSLQASKSDSRDWTSKYFRFFKDPSFQDQFIVFTRYLP